MIITLEVETNRDLLESYLVTNGYNFVEELPMFSRKELAKRVLATLIDSNTEELGIRMKGWQ